MCLLIFLCLIHTVSLHPSNLVNVLQNCVNIHVQIFTQRQIEGNQIIICQGETGSGKTTKIPQFFLDSSLLAAGKMIAITQPRRIAAITVAQRVAEERGESSR
jgi:hypothetical protein